MNISVSQQLIMLAFQLTTRESINVCVWVLVKQLPCETQHRILLIITEGRQLAKLKMEERKWILKGLERKQEVYSLRNSC